MGAPALKVFDGKGPLTLRVALQTYVLPTLDAPSKATVQQLNRSVALWEEFEGRNSKNSRAQIPGKSSVSIGTASTDAGLIDDVLLASFRDWCTAEKEHEPTTWNKTWRRMRQILRKLGPAERGNPTGLGKIPRVPHVRLASEPKRGLRIVSLDELDAWYRAAAEATWPDSSATGCASAPRQWRALLVLGYCTGLRTIDAQTLAREAVTIDQHCPDQDVALPNQFGWVSVTPQKTKRHQREVILPMSECLATHLSWLLAGGTSRLFSFGAANRHFSDQWKEISSRAGVRPFHFGDLRKTCNTAFNRMKTGLGKWVLGHAARGVNDVFYNSVMPDLVEYVHKLPLPAAFTELADKPIDRQRRLF